MNISTLQTLSYNLHKSHTVFDSFFNNPLTLEVPLIFIQEPPKKPQSENQMRSWPGYNIIYPSTNMDEQPFTGIYIQKAFQEKICMIETIEIPSPNITGVRIKMKEDSVPVNFINVYNRPDSYTLLLVSDIVRQLANQPTHLLGDFNAHHPAWNPTELNTRTETDTEEMVSLLQQYNFTLVSPPGIPTRYGRGSATTIDLYWLSSTVEHFDTVYCSVDDEYDSLSDHRPLHLIIRLEYGADRPYKRWNLKKADWEKGKRKLAELLHTEVGEDLLTTDEIERLARHLSNSIVTALNVCAPKLKLTLKSKRWWTPELAELREIRTDRLRTSQKTHLPNDKLMTAIAQKAYKRAIRVAKAKCWNLFLESIQNNEIHKAARYVKKGNIPTPFIPPLTKADGSLTSSPGEQAQVLFDQLLKGDNHSRDVPQNSNHLSQLDDTFPEVTSWEVCRALSQLKEGKATGPDGISVTVLAQFWEVLERPIINIARASLRLGYFPECYKTATCIVIPKPHKKSYKNAKSYRPISLLNHISKAIEIIVTRRLQHEMDTLNLIPDTHFGCRKGTGTDDALFCVTEFIKEAWQRKKVVAALALDAQGAFNNVVHEKLLEDCREVGISEYLIRWIRSFLHNRKVQFQFSNYTSSTFTLTQGSPQGSPISGPLYLLYNSALIRRTSEDTLSKNFIRVGYADDVLWLASGTTAETARQAIEDRLQEASHWSKTHSTPLDIDKTQYVLFTRNHNKMDDTELKWGDKRIRCSPSMKYLGVMLDRRLSFQEQTTMMARRGYAAAAAIGRLANTKRGVSTRQFLMLYKTHVCAATDYASHVWLNPYGQSGKAIRTLELLQNRTLRKALGAVRTTPIQMLHFETAFLSPRERIRMQVASYIMRLFSKPENNLLQNQIRHISSAPRKSFISPVTNLLIRDAELVARGGKVESIVPHPLTPWHENKYIVLISDSAEEAVAEHKELLKLEDTAWNYYTDGSMAEGNVAVGVVSYNKDLVRWDSNSYYVGPETCFGIYEAELLAIYMALASAYNVISTVGTSTPQDIYIHTDNQAALQALQSASASGPAQYILKQIINKGEEMEALAPNTYINFNWIPGHKGIEGNERADRAANEGRTKTENKLPIEFELKSSLSALKRGLREQFTAPMRIEANHLTEITSRSAKLAVGKLTSLKTAKLLESLPRATRSLAVQLRTGHFPITKSYRYRFRLTDSPKCNTCRLDDTISHRIFICRRHITSRSTLRKKINALGVRFELGPMLRNAKTLQALYEFFRPQVFSSVMTSGHPVQP